MNRVSFFLRERMLHKDIYRFIFCFFITLIQYLCFFFILRELNYGYFISLFGINFLCLFIKIPNIFLYSYLLIYTVVLFFGTIFLKFGRAFNSSDVCAFLDSEIIESISFIIEYKYCLLIFIPIIIIIYISKYFKSEFRKIYLIITLCIFINPYNKIVHIIYEGFDSRSNELKNFYSKREFVKRDLDSVDFKMNNNNNTIVVIIGESANRNYMSSFGYSGSVTTPELDKTEWVKFPFAVSYDTMTSSCVPASLSYANSYNNKKITESFSIVDVLNKLDADTYWISNQSKYGSPLIRILGDSCKKTVFMNSNIAIKDLSKLDYSSINDGNIPEVFSRYFINRNKNKTNIFFIHLYGSHFPYSLRYTDDYKKNNHNTIEEYISSIMFTDMILSKIRHTVDQEEKSPCAIIYYSDHGEDVGKPRSLKVEDFNHNMVEIPFAIYFSNKFKIDNNEKIINIEKNKNNIFTNDLIYNTITGLLNITKDHTEDDIYDISCDKFNIKNPLTLHKKIIITKDNNNLQYKEKNINNIILNRKYYFSDEENIKWIGFSDAEKNFRWSNNKECKIQFLNSTAQDCQIKLHFSTLGTQNIKIKINESVIFNDKYSGEKILSSDNVTLIQGINTISFKIPDAHQPDTEDKRLLGIALYDIIFKQITK